MAMTLLTRRDPFADFDAMIRRAFPTAPRTGPFSPVDRAAGRAGQAGRAAVTPEVAWVPASEIIRRGDDALITLDLPGLDFAQDIDVELDGNRLVVRGERPDPYAARSDSVSDDASSESASEGGDETPGETAAEAAQRVRGEVRYGAFRRSFTLPESVAAESLSASYDAGVLTVRVAGAYAGTEPSKITVTAGTPGTTVDAAHDAIAG